MFCGKTEAVGGEDCEDSCAEKDQGIPPPLERYARNKEDEQYQVRSRVDSPAQALTKPINFGSPVGAHLFGSLISFKAPVLGRRHGMGQKTIELLEEPLWIV